MTTPAEVAPDDSLRGRTASLARGETALSRPGSEPLTVAETAAGNALEAALRERAPALHESTPVVRRIATAICRTLGHEESLRQLVDLCAQVRDVGMIGLPDDVVLATGRLSAADWQLLSTHPARSGELLQAVNGPAAAVPIVRHHHERWDGQGYPDGLSGTDIPLLSRVIAVADGFVAIARDRPHRRGSGTDAALVLVGEQAAAHFDPEILGALTHVVMGLNTTGQAGASRREPDDPRRGMREAAASGSHGFGRAIPSLRALPAFPLAHQRVLAATDPTQTTAGDLVGAVEADLAMMLAVLTRAAARSGRPIRCVDDAVAVLGPRGVRDAIAEVSVATFPWRTQREATLHQIHVHGLIVGRAAARIARLTERHDENALITLGLLHDIGKLALAGTGVDYSDEFHARTGTPEERWQRETRVSRFDHASIGGLALRRAGLPRGLTDAIEGHHRPEPGSAHAAILRLADMIVHYSQGEPVNRTTLLDLASTCNLSAKDVQEVLIDLPHGAGSQRRRAEPSPLTDRETEVLRLLADGLVYTQIGLRLSLMTSTIRSHLHNIYSKLDVVDRAQAVLRASEMGWI